MLLPRETSLILEDMIIWDMIILYNILQRNTYAIIVKMS